MPHSYLTSLVCRASGQSAYHLIGLLLHSSALTPAFSPLLVTALVTILQVRHQAFCKQLPQQVGVADGTSSQGGAFSDMRQQQRSSNGIAILSLVLTVPALLYILAAIAFQSYKAVTGFTGPYPLLDLGYPQQLVIRLFVMYLVSGPPHPLSVRPEHGSTCAHWLFLDAHTYAGVGALPP
jgi:hypothetical protein